MIFFKRPFLAIWSTPLMPLMSPAAIGCSVVRLRGWPVASKCSPMAFSIRSGQPSPLDDDTETVAPSGIREAASAGVICLLIRLVSKSGFDANGAAARRGLHDGKAGRQRPDAILTTAKWLAPAGNGIFE